MLEAGKDVADTSPCDCPEAGNAQDVVDSAVAPPLTCIVNGPTPASTITATGGPQLAVQDGVWGLAWLDADMRSVLYSAVDASGAALLPGVQIVAIQLDQVGELGDTHIASVAGNFAIASATHHSRSPGFPGVTMRLLAPESGVPQGTQYFSGFAPSAAPPALDGVSPLPAPASFVTGSRLNRYKPGDAYLHVFNATPTHTQRIHLAEHATALGSVWAPSASRLGAAGIDSNAPAEALRAVYNKSLSGMGVFPAAGPTAIPAADGTWSDISVADAEGRFAISWIDERDGTRDVYLSLLDAVTGAHVGAEASTRTCPGSTGTATPKLAPGSKTPLMRTSTPSLWADGSTETISRGNTGSSAASCCCANATRSARPCRIAMLSASPYSPQAVAVRPCNSWHSARFNNVPPPWPKLVARLQLRAACRVLPGIHQPLALAKERFGNVATGGPGLGGRQTGRRQRGQGERHAPPKACARPSAAPRRIAAAPGRARPSQQAMVGRRGRRRAR